MGAPTHVRGVWPKAKDRRHLVQRHAERDEGDGATTGDREDTPSTLRLEPPDPDGSMNDGGRAGETIVPVSRQEGGEPAKKER